MPVSGLFGYHVRRRAAAEVRRSRWRPGVLLSALHYTGQPCPCPSWEVNHPPKHNQRQDWVTRGPVNNSRFVKSWYFVFLQENFFSVYYVLGTLLSSVMQKWMRQLPFSRGTYILAYCICEPINLPGSYVSHLWSRLIWLTWHVWSLNETMHV